MATGPARHATPIDADAPLYGDLKLTDKTNRLSYPYGILVNLDGERFVDEGADFNSYAYAAYGAATLDQRNATAFEVFDSRAFPLLEKRYETGIPVEATSFEELVAGIDRRYPMLGLDIVAMLKTIVGYNRTAGAKDRGRYDYGLSASASAPAKAGPASKRTGKVPRTLTIF